MLLINHKESIKLNRQEEGEGEREVRCVCVGGGGGACVRRVCERVRL